MRLGVDFGGTKIEAALMDAGGELLTRRRTPNPGSYEGALKALAALTAEVEREVGARANTVGIAMPGSLSPVSGLVRNSNSVWLNGKPFLEDLQILLARPVRVANDANCFALSEAVDGAAKDGRIVLGVILGTGCGGGVVVDKSVIEGASGIAGEIGHTPLPWARHGELPAPICWCGRAGCLETWVSGSGFKRWSGRSADAAAVSAAKGDSKAVQDLDLLYDRIARGLAVIMGIIDPDVIVFGGGVSNVEELPERVRAKLLPYVFSDHLAVKLVRNAHGDSSGVRGAAWLFKPEEAQ